MADEALSPNRVPTIYAWHDEVMRSLWARPESLHHGLLITGPAGIGKGVFAEALAARLLCERPQGHVACGTCPACHWFAGGNHPDYRRVTLQSDEATEGEGAADSGAEPATGKASKGGSKSAAKTKAAKKPATQILIEQIRGLEDFVFIGSHRQGRRVAVIDPADALNVNAANALLKMLEEPPPHVHFLLVTSRWRNLLPTLRSRCRRVELPMPDPAVASAWLAQQALARPDEVLRLAGGAPLKALELDRRGSREGLERIVASLANVNDPVATAAIWDSLLKSQDTLSREDVVDTLQKWVADLLRQGQGIAPRFIVGGEPAKALGALASRCDARRLQRFHRDLMRIRATARHPLNAQLFLEDVAARYAQAVTPARRAG